MLTSINSVWALATESAYTAANAFQDVFTRYRQQLGMPATSLPLGFVENISELSQNPVVVDKFVRNRVLSLSEGEFRTQLVPAFLNANDYCDDDKWIGQTEGPLSASNFLACLDPGAMAAKERVEVGSKLIPPIKKRPASLVQ
ncbi:hypothetical protein F4860DRAFT_86027 [Xylaria cubensis]|nr:hypothetical protein F4860DRAFT_86027 [Xylaria cubensis]